MSDEMIIFHGYIAHIISLRSLKLQWKSLKLTVLTPPKIQCTSVPCAIHSLTEYYSHFGCEHVYFNAMTLRSFDFSVPRFWLHQVFFSFPQRWDVLIVIITCIWTSRRTLSEKLMNHVRAKINETNDYQLKKFSLSRSKDDDEVLERISYKKQRL